LLSGNASFAGAGLPDVLPPIKLSHLELNQRKDYCALLKRREAMSSELTGSSVIRILIVDDHPAAREGLAIRLSQHEQFTICAEADDAEQGYQLATETRPDIIIADISLRDSDGIDLIKRLKARDPNVRILVWSMHPDHLYAEPSLRAGARGYINKQHATGVIFDAIREVMAGKTYLSHEIRDKLIRLVADNRNPLAEPEEVLTKRETEVFGMIGQGRKTTEIAQELNVSARTIETHRVGIKKKLGLADATELIRCAVLWWTRKERNPPPS
jgi:DNA-binding NarL/FixJ family response regulator